MTLCILFVNISLFYICQKYTRRNFEVLKAFLSILIDVTVHTKTPVVTTEMNTIKHKQIGKEI